MYIGESRPATENGNNSRRNYRLTTLFASAGCRLATVAESRAIARKDTHSSNDRLISRF